MYIYILLVVRIIDLWNSYYDNIRAACFMFHFVSQKQRGGKEVERRENKNNISYKYANVLS